MSLFGQGEPESVEVCGKPFQCTVCGNDTFWRKQVQLNTAVATFLNFDWANRSATCAICSQCGYIHWFLP